MTQRSLLKPRTRALKVGNTVRYKRWTALVRKAYDNGTVDLDWLGPWPTPWFNGPYQRDELTLLENPKEDE